AKSGRRGVAWSALPKCKSPVAATRTIRFSWIMAPNQLLSGPRSGDPPHNAVSGRPVRWDSQRGERMASPTQSTVETPSRAFYREAMDALNRAGVPFLVGGSFAFLHQSGIDRFTKDLDLFVRPEHVHKLLEAATAAGYTADLIHSHWLA